MPATTDDLTPFFQDRCWMFVILARQAEVGVILRRGPTEWWRVTLWDTRRDRFEPGQWFRGRIYPEACDVSPDGKLFLYFAAKHSRWGRDDGYSPTWTAVSRPPYLTALALWPMGGIYGGSGVFLDNRAVLLAHDRHHPDHPSGPLRVVTGSAPQKSGLIPVPSYDHGWTGVLAPGARTRCSEYRKASGQLVLGREVPPDYFRPSRRRTLYTIYDANGVPLTLFEAHWADWDQNGRLVAAVGGRVFVGRLTKKHELRWRQLASMADEQPARMESPDWARRW